MTLFGFGWGNDEAYIKRMDTAGQENFNVTNTIGSWVTPGTSFIGDFDGALSALEFYVIHSLTVYNDEAPGNDTNLHGAPYNCKSFD